MNKETIDKIFNERYKNDSNSKILSVTLNQWIDSIFSEPDRILYELLQNADDAFQEQKDGVHYDIYLLNQHLVINYNGKHFDDKEIENLFYVTFIEELENEAFAKLFWNRLLHSSVMDTIRIQEEKVSAFVQQGKEKIKAPSLFKYYIQNHPSFPTLENGCLPCLGIYSYKLKQWCEGKRPIAAFEMPAEVEQYLGIQNKLQLEDHLTLLEEYSQNVAVSDIQLKIVQVYSEIMLNINQYTSEDKKQILDWAKHHRLLSDDNSFQLANQLYYFQVTGFSPPQKDDEFRYVKLKNALINPIDFCQLFGIKVVQKEDLKIETVTPVLDDNFKEKLLYLLAAIAFDFELEHGDDFEEKQAALKTKIEATDFYTCETMHLTYRNVEKELIYESPILSWIEGTAIYYEGAWGSAKVLYDLLPQLCEYLDLKGRERELQLMLSLSEDGLVDWLKMRGASVDLLKTIKSNLDVIGEVEPVYKTNPKGKKLQGGALEPYADGDIGYKGEEFVYKSLQKQYNPDCVIWLNEQEEQQEPYDIKVVLETETIYIDVKTTASKDPLLKMYMSAGEYQFMKEHQDNYQLYRVSDVTGSPNLTVLSFEDWTGFVLKEGYWVEVSHDKNG